MDPRKSTFRLGFARHLFLIVESSTNPSSVETDEGGPVPAAAVPSANQSHPDERKKKNDRWRTTRLNNINFFYIYWARNKSGDQLKNLIVGVPDRELIKA